MSCRDNPQGFDVVAAGLFGEFSGFVRIGIGGIRGRNVDGIFHAGQFAELGFYDDALVVGILDDLLVSLMFFLKVWEFY